MQTPQAQSHNSKLRIPIGEGKGERVVSCTVLNCKGGRLEVIAAEGIPSGTAVSVEYEDALLLGEVIVTAPKPHAWHLAIQVEHVLNGLMNLMALRERLLEETPAALRVSVTP